MNAASGGGGLARVTLGYLGLPLLLFLLGWLKPIYGLPLAAMLFYLLFMLTREINGGECRQSAGSSHSGSPASRWIPPILETRDAEMTMKTLMVCGVVALLWTGLSGAGGMGLQNGDYLKHNAILKTLILFDWPAGLDDERMLVYTIGYYLPAAAVGKVFGWAAANLAQFAWTAAGVWLTLLWFTRLAGGRALFMAPLFVLLSGMDVILWQFFHPESLQWGRHLEWATGRWYFQFSSMSTLLFWTPQHALPGWLGAALFLQFRDSSAFQRGTGLLVACVFLWSVFAALGVALLMLVWLSLRPRHLRAVFSPPSAAVLTAAGGALLITVLASYLLSNDFNFPMEFYARAMTEQGLWPRYGAFLLAEYALVGGCALLLLRRRGGDELAALLCALMAVLAGLHLYKVSGDPDLAMRTSIPLLFVFWCIVCSSLHGGALRRSAPGASIGASVGTLATVFAGALRSLIIAAVVLGAATPFMEIYRSVTHYRMSPPPLTEVKDMDNFSDWPPHHDQYIGQRRSFFFRELAR